MDKYTALNPVLDHYNEGLITIDDVLSQYIVILMKFQQCHCPQCSTRTKKG